MRTIDLACVALALGALSGCGGRPATHPVSGALTYQGKPVAGAVVTLIPAQPIHGLELAYPRGETGSDGKFALKTFAPGDGAPAGEYKLTVLLPEVKRSKPKTPAELEDALTGEKHDRLGGRFADPQKTPWTVTIRSGDNALGSFDLAGQGVAR